MSAAKKSKKKKVGTLNVRTGEFTPVGHADVPTPVLGVPLERLEQIVAEAKVSRPGDDWTKLVTLITEYAVAYGEDVMKGGGDPEAMPIIEQELELSRMRLNYHINHMRHKLEGK